MPGQGWDLPLLHNHEGGGVEYIGPALLLAALSGLSAFLMTSADSPDIFFSPVYSDERTLTSALLHHSSISARLTHLMLVT